MKLSDIDPKVTEWKNGRRRNVGAWSFADCMSAFYNDTTSSVRYVYHYGTCMGVFVFNAGWVFHPMSVGWGSVSDQGGMNRMLKGYGWYYTRKGGAEYILA